MQVSRGPRMPYQPHHNRGDRNPTAERWLRIVHWQFKLPATRQFESRAEWSGPEIVVPKLPDLLPTRETEYIREHQGMLVSIGGLPERPRCHPRDDAPATTAARDADTTKAMEGQRNHRRFNDGNHRRIWSVFVETRTEDSRSQNDLNQSIYCSV
jgi:hypothetical protein